MQVEVHQERWRWTREDVGVGGGVEGVWGGLRLGWVALVPGWRKGREACVRFVSLDVRFEHAWSEGGGCEDAWRGDCVGEQDGRVSGESVRRGAQRGKGRVAAERGAA